MLAQVQLDYLVVTISTGLFKSSGWKLGHVGTSSTGIVVSLRLG